MCVKGEGRKRKEKQQVSNPSIHSSTHPYPPTHHLHTHPYLSTHASIHASIHRPSPRTSAKSADGLPSQACRTPSHLGKSSPSRRERKWRGEKRSAQAKAHSSGCRSCLVVVVVVVVCLYGHGKGGESPVHHIQKFPLLLLLLSLSLYTLSRLLGTMPSSPTTEDTTPLSLWIHCPLRITWLLGTMASPRRAWASLGRIDLRRSASKLRGSNTWRRKREGVVVGGGR